jgi:hypothetical protein
MLVIIYSPALPECIIKRGAVYMHVYESVYDSA